MSLSSGDGIDLLTPGNGTTWTYSANGYLSFSWYEAWYCTGCDGSEVLLVWDSSGNQVAERDGVCPASTSPSCPTQTQISLPPGSYTWGVGVQLGSNPTHVSDIWSFVITAAAPAPTATTTVATTTTVVSPPTTAPTTTAVPPPATTTAAPPQRAVPTSADTDKDGILDSADKCPGDPAGPYDTNKNGCAGPFARIKPRLAYGDIVTSRGIANIKWISIGGVPPGAAVILRAGRLLSVRLVAARSGGVRTSRIGSINFEDGATFALRVTRPGWIGYDATIRVSASRKPYPVREQCVSAAGRQVVARCSSVDKGR